jgi:protein required for attachment to host cells
MTSYQVVVADSDNVNVYALASVQGALEKTSSFSNPAAGLRSHDLGASAPGRTQSGSGSMRHAYQPRHTLKERATEQFVRSVIAALVAQEKRKANESIVLVASPRLITLYKRLMPRALKAKLTLEVPRDLVKLPKTVLAKRIRVALSRR